MNNFIPFDEHIRLLKRKPKLSAAHKNLMTWHEAEARRLWTKLYYDKTTAVHSFADADGQVWDCMPVEKQPSLKGKRQRLPKSPPPIPIEAESGKVIRSAFPTGDDAFGNRMFCDDGCVPIRRQMTGFLYEATPLRTSAKGMMKSLHVDADAQGDTSTHHHSYAMQEVESRGLGATFNLWQPPVQANEMSLAQLWVTGGRGNNFQSVEAGWHIDPLRYNGSVKPRLFIYYTTDGYQAGSAFNHDKPGAFVQQSAKVMLGGVLQPCSSTGGVQVEISLKWLWFDGVWWLYVDGIPVGHYTKLFGNGVLSRGAERLATGGEVAGESHLPPMGSGGWPEDGYGYSAYVRNIEYTDATGVAQPMHLTTDSSSSLYRVNADTGGAWGHYIYYGGPGGSK